jgi:hypothetical protein
MEASDVKNASTHASADDVQLPESVSAALQYELAEADRTVQETLAEVWSRWCSPPISLAKHTHAELVPAFENYAERILRARAGALMQVIDTVVCSQKLLRYSNQQLAIGGFRRAVGLLWDVTTVDSCSI